ncbi:MAG TPA: tRNA (adenosine(37)-N6)-threonylcarbamoyltransferase complex ATPase subunit type 1 TsaE [Elusimicrobiota bacterium]|nr:tRNA (adenosine(37)-N6)-threonylcarbamoyltransferase complex ATPase subunit type 1 TsaE [Elusimicrobiota bacterium]
MTGSSRTFTTQSAEQTVALGRRLGKVLRGGDVVLLSGDLGSGKTTLAKGIAAGAGFRGLVASPTFTLAHTYGARRGPVYHLDLYRVAAAQSGDIGLEDFLGDAAAVCLIEWPRAAQAYCPKDRLEVAIAVVPRGRRLTFRGRGPRARAVVAALEKS